MAKGDLLARLQRGASLDDVAERLTAPVAVALMRSFNREDYGFAVMGSEAPGLEELPGLIRLGSDQFAIADSERKSALAGQSPGEIQTIAQRLYPLVAGSRDPLRRLTLQLFADPPGALREWEKLYAEADKSFDIPRCSMLLEILRTRAELLSPELREACLRYDEYLRARTLFADDYYRSASYLERDELTKAFREFWADPDQWAMRLYGKGGSGKTMFVRWLIARYCVPRLDGSEPIAVARVDFDFLKIDAFAARPWLTLVPLARQLSPQLPNNPFDTLNKELAELIPLLNWPEPLPPAQAAIVDARRGQVESMFAAGLADRPVLLVFDTCEEPLIHRREAFQALLKLLTGLQKDCGGLRLLLSGRYDIKGLPGAVAKAVGEFTREERIRYLTELRGMPEGVLVKEIARKSKGRPFSLGLFAELYQSPGGLTVREVREAPSDDFIYLLDRVILRIPNESVRWLVRYAVIPRELTFDFAANVLSRLLDDTSGDDANTFSGDLAKRYAERRPWPQVKFGELQKIWDDLVQYASDPSWIEYNEAAGTIQLQPEVYVPMRKLLRENAELHRLLQEDAERYWKRRAKEHPAEFVRCRIEALFHSFQRQGAAAGTDLLQLEADRRFRSTADRAQLGELILSRDFLDDARRPIMLAKNRPIVSAEIVARARFLVAVHAIIGRLHLGRESEDAKPFTSTLAEQWTALAKQSAYERLTKAEWTLIRDAHTVFVRRRVPAAATLRVLRFPKPLRLAARMMALRISYDRLFVGLPTDARDVAPALALSKELKSTEFPVGHIQYRAALFHLRTGDLNKALSAFTAALWQLPASGPMSRDRVECFWRAAGILRVTGRWREWQILTELIERRIAADDPDRSAFLFQYWMSRAALAIDLGEADAAEGYLTAARGHAGYDFAQAAWHDLQGELATLRVDVSQAVPQLNEAIKLYGKARNGATRSTLLTARFWLAAGNLAHARRILPKPPRDWQLELECALAGAQLGRRFQVVAGPRAVRARLLATALAHGRTKGPERFFKELRGLSTDERLAALVPFGETDRVLPNAGRWRSRVKSALPGDPEKIEGSIAVVQTIALANACRFFGDSERAGRLLALVGPRLGIVELWRQRAMRRLRPAPAVPEKLSFPRFASTSALEAISRLERTEWLIEDGNLSAAKSVIPPAGLLPQGLWLARLKMAEAVVDAHDAAVHYRSASAAAAEAGMPTLARKAARLAAQAETGAPGEQAPLIRPVDEWTVAFANSSRGFTLSFQLPGRGGGRFQHASPAWLREDTHALLAMRDWPVRVRELAEIATPFLQHTTAEGTRLRMGTSLTAAIPWEYVARPDTELFFRSGRAESAERETARWMQAALLALGEKVEINCHATDPVFLRTLGGRTTAELRAALRERNLSVLQGITVIEPDREWQYNNKRGYLVEGLHLRAELQASSHEFPSVVDISGMFRLDSRGEAVLDCGEQREYDVANFLVEPGAPLRAETLAERLLAYPADRVRPLVILDAIPSSEPEAGRLGMLRNLFCMQLFDTGAARAVLGFGLANGGRARETVAVLKQSFEERLTVGELHRNLLRVRDRFAFPPALWADDPDLPAYRS